MIHATLSVELRTEEICQSVAISDQMLFELVDHGIVAPPGDTPQEWLFDSEMLATVKQALRLRRELEIDWPGVALALDLLNEVQQLRAENAQLRQRLARFLQD